MRWWREHNLAHPMTISRRLLFWPILQAGRLLMCLGALLGWGLYEATQLWNTTR